MSVLAKLFNAGRAGVTPAGQEQRILTSSAFVPPPQVGVIDDYVGVHRAMACMSVLACVRILADTIASLPWKAYRRDAKGVPKEVRPQPLLLRQPFPGFDLFQWKWMVVASLALRGNSYHLVTSRDKMNYPTSLLPLHPDVVFLERRPDLLLWFDPVYRIMGEEIPTSDLIHIRRFTMPGEPWGLSPVKQAAVAIGVSLASEEYGYRYFKESANPSGILSTDQDLDDKAVERQQKNWIASHGGRRLPAVLTGGFKWEGLSISPEESQFLATRQFQRSEICLLYGVPPILIGDTKETTAWGCLPSSAQVFTTNGPVPIKNVKKGDEVWSYDGQQIVKAKVTGWVMTGYKPLMTIKTLGRELQLTSNHHIPVRRYFGKADGRIVSRTKGTCGWETIEIDAGDVRIGDYLIVPHGMGDGETRATPEGQELTVGMMEFAGLYLGDGCRSNQQVIICHGHGRDADHIGHYRQVIEREFGKIANTDAKGTQTRFSSPGAITLLEAGFTGTATTKRVPGWVFGLAPELQLALLRGYLDADGSVQRGAIIYSSAHKALLEDMRHLCIQLGIPVGKVKVGRWGGEMTVRGKTYQSSEKYELALTSLQYNRRIGSNSPHKAERFTELGTDRSGRSGQRRRRFRYDPDWTGVSYGNRKPIGAPPAGAVYHKVTAIERSNVEVPVYDIEVAGPAHYLADGIIVANTGVEQITLGAITYTFRSWTGCIESMVSSCLPRGQFVRFDFDALLRGDIEGRYQAYQRAVGSSTGAGWVTPNEIRAKEEMDPVDGGDTLWMSNRMVPAHTALVTPAPDGSPTDGPPGGGVGPASYPTPPIGGGENSDDPVSHSRRLLTADGNSFAR